MIAVKPPFKKTTKHFKILRNQQEYISFEIEEQLYDAVCTFLILSEIFVSAPYGVHRRISNGGRCHTGLLLLHYIWCLIVYTILATSVWTESSATNINLSSTEKPLYSSEFLVYLVHVLQIIIAGYLARSKFKKFLHTIALIDQGLLRFNGVFPDYSVHRRFLYRHLQLILVHFVFTAVIEYYYCDGVFDRILSSTMVYMLPNIILHISLVQYYALLFTIAIRWGSLNRVLQVELEKIKVNPLLAVQMRLQQIRLLFLRLELFTRDVNDAFGPSIVLVYVGSYLNITINLLIIYKYMDNVKISDWPWIMYSVVWICMHMGKMFLILYYNHCVKKQKSSTAFLLNDIKGHTSEMEETITHFMFQMICNTRSNVVCGVAILNLDYIKSLLVAISTLFIFLLQYDITFEALTLSQNSGTPTRTS